MRVLITSVIAVLASVVVGCSNNAVAPQSAAVTEPAVQVDLRPLANTKAVAVSDSDDESECGSKKPLFLTADRSRDFVSVDDQMSVKTLGATPPNPSSTATYVFRDAQPSVRSAYVVVSTRTNYDIHSGYVIPAAKHRFEVVWPQQALTEAISVSVDADDFSVGTHLVGIELCTL